MSRARCRLRLVSAVLLVSTLVLPTACDLPEETSDVVGGSSGDAETGDAPVGGGELGDASVSTDVGGEDIVSAPVSCDRLAGQWQISVCGGSAVSVQLVRSGCDFSVTSPDPTLLGGVGHLDRGHDLFISFPGGAWGSLQCEARMMTSAFNGTCHGAAGDCPITGVRSW